MVAPKTSRIVVLSLVALVALCALPNLTGCGSMDSPTVPMVAPTAEPSAGVSAAPTDTLSAVATLTLSLSTTLDNVTGTVKATSITSADLLQKGAVVKTATMAGGSAQFDMTGLANGDYFIRVNNLAADLVPTRITNATTSFTQFVGQKLRQSVIGTLASPTFRILTFSRGQAQTAIVAYSTGAVLIPAKYAYAIQSLKTGKKLDTLTLGTAAKLASTPTGGEHPATWEIGPSNHGKSASQASCGDCHGNLNSKPATYPGISPSNGWCYRCHYGAAGATAGMVNPKK